MPFATLPSSQGFTPPQAPDWSPFALAALRERANRPIPNTAEMVNQAVQQIDHILELSSPQARLQRQLQLEQLGALRDTWRDYHSDPSKYQMTAHGPMLRDPYDLAMKRSTIRKNIAQANQLDREGNPVPLIGEIDRITKNLNAHKVTDVDALPPTQGTVVGGSANNNVGGSSLNATDAADSQDGAEASTETGDGY